MVIKIVYLSAVCVHVIAKIKPTQQILRVDTCILKKVFCKSTFHIKIRQKHVIAEALVKKKKYT